MVISRRGDVDLTETDVLTIESRRYTADIGRSGRGKKNRQSQAGVDQETNVHACITDHNRGPKDRRTFEERVSTQFMIYI